MCYCTYFIVYTSYSNFISAHGVDVWGVGVTLFEIIVFIDLFVYIYYYVLSVRKLYWLDLWIIVYMILYIFPCVFKPF